jgi:hypothetical protein
MLATARPKPRSSGGTITAANGAELTSKPAKGHGYPVFIPTIPIARNGGSAHGQMFQPRSGAATSAQSLHKRAGEVTPREGCSVCPLTMIGFALR